MKVFGKALFGICFLALPLLAVAEEATPMPSVEDNIHTMDKDRDGMVTVYELRAFIEAKHGKGYKKRTLDDMEATASGTSCTTPFSKPLY
jgi:hypothetical protein